MNKGDVVYLDFPNADGTAGKRRPALAIANVTYADVIVCSVTTQPAKNAYAVAIKAGDFVAGGLPKDSYVRPERLFTLSSSLVQGQAGALSKAKVNEVVANLMQLIRK